MTAISLECECGRVQGVISDAVSGHDMRVICYCDDCQAFARVLGRANIILDSWGGTEILQVVPPRIVFTKGLDQLRCLRLTAKGLHRWYTNCCKTAVANTISAGMPFAGVIRDFIAGGVSDQELGPVRYRVQGKHAHGTPPGHVYSGFPARSFFSFVPSLLLVMLRGQHRLSPFYDRKGKPVSKPEVLMVS